MAKKRRTKPEEVRVEEERPKSIQEQWAKPPKVAGMDVAFGMSASQMPQMDQIPEEFHDGHNPWCKWQMKWFYQGLKQEDVPEVKPGIDREDALRVLKSIQTSFDPKHEHKEAAVAFLASLWFQPLRPEQYEIRSIKGM